MNAMNYDRKMLKNRAKASLRGIRPRPWKPTLVYLLIASFVPMAVSLVTQLVGSGGMFAQLQEITELVDTGAYLHMSEGELISRYVRVMAPVMTTGLVSLFVSILTSLIQVVMEYGYVGYSLKLWRGEQTAVKDVFSGFGLAGRAICTSIVSGIFVSLWSLLAVALLICAIMISAVAAVALDSTALLVILTILFYAAFFAAIFCITYRYSLAPYFIVTTDMDTMDAIRASKNAMRGNIGRRFMLDLSFIGWELLMGLIILLVIYAGIFISIFAAGFSLAMSGAVGDYLDPAAELMLLSQFMGGVVISMIVGVLATLPLSLWLTPYKGAAKAGFFMAVTGQDDIPAAPRPAPEYIPPQPSGIWDNVPQPPSFTSPGAQPPVPPAPPKPPTPPQPPVVEIPEWMPPGPGPNDPIPAAPAEPVAVVEEPEATAAEPEKSEAPVAAVEEPETPAAEPAPETPTAEEAPAAPIEPPVVPGEPEKPADPPTEDTQA